MASNSTYSVPYRRKREGRTDYKNRMKLLLGRKPRIVLRKSLKHLSLQLVEFNPSGDKVVASAHSRELAKFGWTVSTSNTTAAYLTGLLLAKKVKKNTECVLDIGGRSSVKGSTIYAAAKGCIDGGLLLPCSKEVMPDMKRIKGEHVAEYAKTLKSDKARFERQFAKYSKAGIDPSTIPSLFEKVKLAIEAQKIGAA